MNLDFNPEDQAFRAEVRAFIADHYPVALREAQNGDQPFVKEDHLRWQKVLAQKGWAAPHWPSEFGGTGWTLTQRHIWQEELGRIDAFALTPFGLGMLAPVLYTFGTEEQKKRFLPPIYKGELWFCQGYSEPGAGSDLASLRTRAERFTDDDGKDYYLVNGQKTWTTLAQYADWGFFLVRTDPMAKPQAGISFLLIDMKSPGITVRPIITIDGAHEVNDVYLDNVKVPVENRVHDENKGWTCAKALLAHERVGIAEVAWSKEKLRKLYAVARTEPDDDGRMLIDNPYFRRKLTQVELDLMALEMTELRSLAAEYGGQAPGPESSILKIKGTEIKQRLQELAVDAAAHAAVRSAPGGDHNLRFGPHVETGVAGDYFNGRKYTIFGGSNEIQRNIIAKAVLGL
jgi:alkylation response protein AidB-like acyl-CoA dehydrogenase